MGRRGPGQVGSPSFGSDGPSPPPSVAGTGTREAVSLCALLIGEGFPGVLVAVIAIFRRGQVNPGSLSCFSSRTPLEWLWVSGCVGQIYLNGFFNVPPSGVAALQWEDPHSPSLRLSGSVQFSEALRNGLREIQEPF